MGMITCHCSANYHAALTLLSCLKISIDNNYLIVIWRVLIRQNRKIFDSVTILYKKKVEWLVGLMKNFNNINTLHYSSKQMFLVEITF